MSLYVFEIFENIPEDMRQKYFKSLNNHFSYKLLFDDIKQGESGPIDFSILLYLLRVVNIEYSMGDNVIGKLKDACKIISEQQEKYYRHRKIIPSVYSFNNLLKNIKQTNSKYKKTMFVSKYMAACDDIELKWTVHLLVNRPKIRGLIGYGKDRK